MLLQGCADVDHLAIHPGAGKALRQGLLERSQVRAFAVRASGASSWKRVPGRQAGQLVGDLLGALGLDGLPAARAVRRAQAGIEHAQVIQHLGHRAQRWSAGCG